ncbi:acyltransferase family protein [Halodesulfovibrio marinisediminis]|uniref:Acyltransferase family protein n=1 Tax=Halodesulfovibrio marinisediminis DSM 17456 TaxID=1121457 RepID=A0A1N6FV25_9BACT|nr:acyltransferase family protein [Halodesulfovibrio marinisediminis]SIN99135.1 Acyltransferase family protein [Halodesulfovibrio marinisediminis DSM 17456]
MGENRLYFLDNLRASIIFIVVLLHVSLCYMMYAPNWWYVIDPVTSKFFTLLVVLIDVPIMPAMFFIAGYFALPSLRRHGAMEFLWQKVWRLFFPWVLGVVVLAPPTAFMIPFTRKLPVELFSFWTSTFWTEAFQHSVYWFLALLFWMFVGLTLLWKCIPALRELTRTPATAPLWFFPAFVAASAVCFYIVLQFFPVDYWFVSYLLSFQPERVFQHILYFSLGIWAWKYGWFTDGGYRPRKRAWLPVLAITMVVYLTAKMGFTTAHAPLWKKQLVLACSFATYCIASLMGWSALFSTWVNSSGRIWRSAADNSYGIYFLHALIVYWLVYVLIPVRCSIYLKAAVVFITAMALCWFLTAVILRKAPLLRRMF